MNEPFKSSFPRKLKMLRLEHGKSQEELAKELGITRSCLANYELGKRQPDNETLIRIADTFQVLIDYLVDRAEYRDISFTVQEIDDFNRLKYTLEQRETVLDLTPLSFEAKAAVIQYYEFVDTMNRVRR